MDNISYSKYQYRWNYYHFFLRSVHYITQQLSQIKEEKNPFRQSRASPFFHKKPLLSFYLFTAQIQNTITILALELFDLLILVFLFIAVLTK